MQNFGVPTLEMYTFAGKKNCSFFKNQVVRNILIGIEEFSNHNTVCSSFLPQSSYNNNMFVKAFCSVGTSMFYSHKQTTMQCGIVIKIKMQSRRERKKF